METVFNQHSNIFYPGNKADAQHIHLPAGNYIVVKPSPMSDTLALQQVDSFELPAKLYGKTTYFADRVINTFEDRPASTGVLLSGEKGSGKTLQAKAICNAAAARGYPTILINQPWFGDNFNILMQSIKQPAVVYWEEFEKTYRKEDQHHVLTLLDGVFPSKKIYIITCNDKYALNEFMRNRPGRLYYSIEYVGLEEKFIKEYCDDTLQDKSHIDTLCKIAGMFTAFNFDMLKAIVEEMNRYGETPVEVMKVINASLKGESYGTYRLNVSFPGKVLEDTYRDLDGHPLVIPEFGIHTIDVTNYDPKDADQDYPDSQWVLFGNTDFKGMGINGEFLFINEAGFHGTVTKKPIAVAQWGGLLA